MPQLALPSVTSAEAGGFIASLFDLSFTSFITTKLIKVLYVLGIVGAALWALGMAGTGVMQGGFSLILVLVSPALFLIGVIYMRVMMELIMVLFRAAGECRRNRPSGPALVWTALSHGRGSVLSRAR